MQRLILFGCWVFVVMLFLGTSMGQEREIPSAKQLLENARSHDASGDPRAENEYRQAIALRKGVYAEAWRELSWYFSKRLRFSEAAEALKKAIEQNAKAFSNDKRQLMVLRRAAQLQQRDSRNEILSAEEMVELIKFIDQFGESGDAVPYAERAVTLYPYSSKVLVTLAFLVKWEQPNRAVTLLDQAVSLSPEDPAVYVARGWGYYWCKGDGVQAEVDFRKALHLSKGLNFSAWQGLGDALAKQGRKEEAIAAYQKYLTIRPKSASHYDGEVRKSIVALRQDSSQP